MRLLPAQVGQREDLATAPVLQHHRGAAGPLHQRRQNAAITAEGWLLAVLGAEAERPGRLTA